VPLDVVRAADAPRMRDELVFGDNSCLFGRTLMDPRLQRLLDHFDIREVIEAYVHACDRGDRDATADVYHPDSWDDHGPVKCTGPEFADKNTEALMTRWKSCNHLLGQSRINVGSYVAGAETLFYASLTRDANGTQMLDQMVGRYIDRFERRWSQWRLAERRVISEWTSSAPIGEDYLAGHLFLQGQRSEHDLSYEVLGLRRGCSRIVRSEESSSG